MKSTGAPVPARMKLVPSGVVARVHPGATVSAMQVPELLEVLIAVADAMMRAAADGSAKRHDQLVRRWRVADLEMYGQIVRAAAFVILVHQRDHDRRVRPAAQIGEGKIGLGADGTAIMVAEMQRMD